MVGRGRRAGAVDDGACRIGVEVEDRTRAELLDEKADAVTVGDGVTGCR